MQIQRVESEDPCPACGSIMYDYAVMDQGQIVKYLLNQICPACRSHVGLWEIANYRRRIKLGSYYMGVPDPEPAVNPQDLVMLN